MKGKGPDPAGKQVFSTDRPSTACELGPTSLTPQKSVSSLLPTDPRVDSSVPSVALAGPSAHSPCVGPFQGQDASLSQTHRPVIFTNPSLIGSGIPLRLFPLEPLPGCLQWIWQYTLRCLGVDLMLIWRR